VHTKRGFDFPGVKLEASGGSFGRWGVNGEYGGFRGPVDWFVTFNALNEDGWRAHSPSDLRQLFAKIGYRTESADVEMSYVYANNDLTGNGLAPESLLSRDRRAVYTFPDETRNLMHLGNLRGSRWLTDDLLLSTNAFYRYYQRTTLNGDVQISCVDDASDGVAFNLNGRAVHLGQCQGSAAGFVDGQGNPLAGNLARESAGELRRTKTVTQDWGTTLQLSYRGAVLGHGNRATFGSPTMDTRQASPSATPRQSSPRWPERGRPAAWPLRDDSGRSHRPAEHRRVRHRHLRRHRLAGPHAAGAIRT